MNMKSMLLMLSLVVGRLCAQTSDVMSMQCNEPPISSDEQLDKLTGLAGMTDSRHLECLFSYMNDLSKMRDPRALPRIARYLDVENPRISRANPIGGGELLGGEYPAITYIVQYRKTALPVLVKELENERSFSLRAKNAVLALMLIEAPDPPAGVRLLANAAKTGGSSTNALMDAAKFAVNSWQCHLEKADCEKALSDSAAAPQVRKEKPKE